MLSAMIQCGRTNTQKAILLPCGKNCFFFLNATWIKKWHFLRTWWMCFELQNISPFIYLSLNHSVCTFISSQLVLLLSVLYSLCRYGSLLGNPILMHLLFIHNIIKSVPSGRVHFLIFRLVYHFLHNIASLAS